MADTKEKQIHQDDTDDTDGLDIGLDEDDSTLDIVRQMMVEAEASPPPAPARAPDPAAEPVRPAATFPIYAAPIDDLERWDDDAAEAGWDTVYAGAAEDGDYLDDGSDVTARDGFLRRWMRALLAWACARIMRFLRRPDAPRRIALVLLVVSVFAWPWEVFKLSFLIPLALVVTWATVGSHGMGELVVMWHGRLKARDPDKAERIRLRAARTSRAITHAVNQLPGDWKQGFELPDFEAPGHVPEKMKVDPFEGLAAQVHAAKHTDARS